MSGKKCVIVDIDGTIADNSHRQYLIQPPLKNWPRYNSLMHLDKPHMPVLELVWLLQKEIPIILASGRGEEDRVVTQKWVSEYDVIWAELYMRAEKDYRADDIVKGEFLDKILANGWQPLFVIDDRASVVKMWRSRGLVCLQCAPGDF